MNAKAIAIVATIPLLFLVLAYASYYFSSMDKFRFDPNRLTNTYNTVSSTNCVLNKEAIENWLLIEIEREEMLEQTENSMNSLFVETSKVLIFLALLSLWQGIVLLNIRKDRSRRAQ